MLENINLENILFLDIETVPEVPNYDELDEAGKKFWDHKAKNLKKDETENPKDIYHRAGIYSEFGKIICISVGYFKLNEDGRQFRLKSFFGDDEKQLLNEFSNLLHQHFNKAIHLLCAHNGKEFDFPYLSRRMLINRLKLPVLLDTASKKPWEVQHLDTMELWKFGDYKSYTPLNLLAHIFSIPSPKDDIDGSQVWSVYWIEKNLERIMIYCQKDVLTVAQIFLSYRGENILTDSEIKFIS